MNTRLTALDIQKQEQELSTKVLIADDSAFIRMLLREVLEGNGFEVVGDASNGVDAIKKFKELIPDIITMDITMPVMDGIHAVQEILAIDSNAKIIMISAMGQQAMVVDAMKVGAKDFIVKPFEKERVIKTLKKHAMNHTS